jgi:hypothetical protein
MTPFGDGVAREGHEEPPLGKLVTVTPYRVTPRMGMGLDSSASSLVLNISCRGR